MYLDAQNTMEGALTMLALAEFQREHGTFPDSLDELVPQFLPRLPVDFGDLQTLRYRRLENDYLLYSIGEDGVDNGGEGKGLPPRWRLSIREQGDPDIVFSRTVRCTERWEVPR
jgi:hypothetical protein